MTSSNTEIQFISADELRKVAEMEKEERKLRTVDGMIDQMDETHSKLDKAMAEAGQPGLMEMWALEQPGEFFKLAARLKMHNKGSQHVHRIQIGLPMTGLDALPERAADEPDEQV